MSECYNCEGWKVVKVDAAAFCPDCGVVGDFCGCGSKADLINNTKLVDCPICKGSGETPWFQTSFLFQ